MADIERRSVRYELITDLIEAVCNPRTGECIALVGGPGSGRSTVVATLKAIIGGHAFLVSCGEVFADERLDIAGWLRKTVQDALEVERSSVPYGIGEGATLPAGRVVILIDDFDLCLPRLSVGDLQWLRECCSRPEVALVITMRDYLTRLSKSLSHASLFDGIFAATRHCGTLQQSEVVNLINQEWPKKQELSFDLLDWIRSTAGPHPWFLAMLVRSIAKRLQKGAPIDPLWKASVEGDLPNRWSSKCAALWGGLMADEQDVVEAIASERQLPEGVSGVVRTLAALRCVAIEGTKPRLINESFRRFVENEATLSSWSGIPTAYKKARIAVQVTFTEADRDPDPLYYLGRAMEELGGIPRYEEANAMMRAAFEQFCIMTGRRIGFDYQGLTGAGGLKGFFRAVADHCGFEDTFVELGTGISSHLNKQGPHPGKVAIPEDSHLRMDMVSGVMCLVSSSIRVVGQSEALSRTSQPVRLP